MPQSIESKKDSYPAHDTDTKKNLLMLHHVGDIYVNHELVASSASPEQQKYLETYIPQDFFSDEKIQLMDSLSGVLENISKQTIIPKGKIWKMYRSEPSETGGYIRFPYCRIDSNLLATCNSVSHMQQERTKNERREYWGEVAESCCFKSLVWIEIGFGDLYQYADSHASRSWTSGIGHTLSDMERAKRIKTTGKNLYREWVLTYLMHRKDNPPACDLFAQYDLQDLLSQFL